MTAIPAVVLILAAAIWLIGPQAIFNIIAVVAFIGAIFFGLVVIERGP